MKSKSPQSLLIECAFSFSLITATLFAKAHAFEYQAYEKKIKNPYNIYNVVEKLPRRSIEDTLRQVVASGRPNRAVGNPGHEKARAFLEEKLKTFSSQGSEVKKIDFDLAISEAQKSFDKPTQKKISTLKGLKGQNLQWEKKGIIKPEEIIVLSAHYDTLLKDPKTKNYSLQGEMPGADSNASGVAALLSLIEILDKLDLPKTVRVVFLDAEELGSFGSKHYTENLGADKISAYINVSMIAHDSRKEDKEQKLNNMLLYFAENSKALASQVVASGKHHVGSMNFRLVEQKETSLDLPQTFSHFSRKGVPALWLTQNLESDPNPRFLTSNDFTETLNIATYTNVFKFLANTSLALIYDVSK